jgi:hypothetical protein
VDAFQGGTHGVGVELGRHPAVVGLVAELDRRDRVARGIEAGVLAPEAPAGAVAADEGDDPVTVVCRIAELVAAEQGVDTGVDFLGGLADDFVLGIDRVRRVPFMARYRRP